MNTFSKSALKARRERAQAQLNKILQPGDLVLFYSGEPIQKPGGLDQNYHFLPHPDYFWLKGLRRPGGVMAYSRDNGWFDFIKQVTSNERLWEGNIPDVEGEDISQLDSFLEKQKPQSVYILGQPTIQGKGIAVNGDDETLAKIQESFNRARRIKDSEEIELIKRLATVANKGYIRLKEIIRPGLTERQMQLEYEDAVLRAGADKFPYDTIVGSGVNASTLHAMPSQRVALENELVLVDGGADIQDYCVDITRVFSTSKKFTARQKDMYDLVLKMQTTCIAMCKPGVEWFDVHNNAARILAEGLIDLKLLNCDVNTALETGAISTFFPHGVGHMVGQRVRDVGSTPTETPRKTCGVSVRVDLPLEENFIMTVEPGVYFVPTILDHPSYRENFKTEINWSETEKWRDFGGIRLEDDILIKQKPENLTAVVEKM